MTPKFDNLASLLMEMSRPRIPDKTRKEIGDYIEQYPEATYEEIGDTFGVHKATVQAIARELNVSRSVAHGGDVARAASVNVTRLPDDKRLDIMIDIEEHDEDSYRMIAKRHGVSHSTVTNIAREAGLSRGEHRGTPMKRTADTRKKDHSKDPTHTGDVRPHHLKDTEPGIVPSNPKHGGPAHPPK